MFFDLFPPQIRPRKVNNLICTELQNLYLLAHMDPLKGIHMGNLDIVVESQTAQ